MNYAKHSMRPSGRTFWPQLRSVRRGWTSTTGVNESRIGIYRQTRSIWNNARVVSLGSAALSCAAHLRCWLGRERSPTPRGLVARPGAILSGVRERSTAMRSDSALGGSSRMLRSNATHSAYLKAATRSVFTACGSSVCSTESCLANPTKKTWSICWRMAMKSG